MLICTIYEGHDLSNVWSHTLQCAASVGKNTFLRDVKVYTNQLLPVSPFELPHVLRGEYLGVVWDYFCSKDYIAVTQLSLWA